MKSDSTAYGPLMVDVAGTQLTSEDIDLLRHPFVGGLILFSRNYQNREQLTDLVVQARKHAPDLLIAVDQEGGRVQRFLTQFTTIPPMRELGKLYDQDASSALKRTQNLGECLASELLTLGIDFSFAPVLDVDYGLSQVIGNRSFHQDPNVVVALARALIAGFHQAGMAAVGKHFPGHGAVEIDSHLGLPRDKRVFAEIEQMDLVPYRQLVDDLQAVMPAHIIYDAVDEQPAGFSGYWLQTVLREKLAFQGAIFSDDLSMEGAAFAGDYPERVMAALQAGCDQVLVCNNRPGLRQVLNADLPPQSLATTQRLAKMKAGQSAAA